MQHKIGCAKLWLVDSAWSHSSCKCKSYQIHWLTSSFVQNLFKQCRAYPYSTSSIVSSSKSFMFDINDADNEQYRAAESRERVYKRFWVWPFRKRSAFQLWWCYISHSKIHKPILVCDEIARRQQFLNAFCMLFISMEQRVLIKYLREEGHQSTQIHFKLIEYYGNKALSCPNVSDLMRQFRMWRESVEDSRWSERPSDFQTHSESMEPSMYRATVQFEILLRLLALPRQRYSLSSLKFFIWKVVTEDGSPTNWATMRNEQESNLVFRFRSNLRGRSGGTGLKSTLVMNPGYYGKISERMWVESG
jgi:hypothetical protein